MSVGVPLVRSTRPPPETVTLLCAVKLYPARFNVPVTDTGAVAVVAPAREVAVLTVSAGSVPCTVGDPLLITTDPVPTIGPCAFTPPPLTVSWKLCRSSVLPASIVTNPIAAAAVSCGWFETITAGTNTLSVPAGTPEGLQFAGLDHVRTPATSPPTQVRVVPAGIPISVKSAVSAVNVARTTLVPVTDGANVIVEMPAASVTDEVAPSVPEPERTLHNTVAPCTGLANASVTFAASGDAVFEPKKAD